jgi:hypothetical protein
MKTSGQIETKKIYTRLELQKKFTLNDATINTGIFRPKDHKSIWLFITQQKSKDMTQYNDRLEGDDLYVDGQSAGLKDKMLAEHEKNGDEVLLFFRRSKTEHPGGGFRYEGRFQYVSHIGTRPAHFHFNRVKD